ncbi:hypothetical protein [Lacinutrix chionoecetis]
MMIKVITVLLFLCFINFSNAQKTIQELNNTIKTSSSKENIELRRFNDANQLLTVETIKLNKFNIPKDIKKTTVLKYDEHLKALPKIANSRYKALYPNINIKDVFILPEYYVNFPEESEDEDEPLIFTPMIIRSEPLIKDGEKGYKSKISLVLFSENETEKANKAVVDVKLEIVSNALKVKQGKLTLTNLNLPSTDVELYTERAQIKDSVAIRILTNSNLKKGYTHYIKVSPKLTLTTNDEDIQGFGVDKAQILVRFSGSNSKTREQVIVRSNHGEVDPSSFTLAYNEAQLVSIRSQGLKNLKITASTSSGALAIADSNTLVIRQTFPYVFIIASLIGGLLGMVIKLGFKKEKKMPPKLFIAGVLIGFLGAVIYYVLGISFLRFSVPNTFNEFAVLAFSALCSLALKPTILAKM